MDWLKGFAEKLDLARWWKFAIVVGLRDLALPRSQLRIVT